LWAARRRAPTLVTAIKVIHRRGVPNNLKKNRFSRFRGQLNFSLDGIQRFLLASILATWVFYLAIDFPTHSLHKGAFLWTTVPNFGGPTL
jgi:hypothetical protein